MDEKMISWPGWETVRLIGRGSFGAVYEIRRQLFRETEKAALKVISIPQNGSDIEEMYNEGYDDESITEAFQSHLESIVAEYSLMKKLNGCSNIVSCDDVRYIQHEDGIGWDVYIKMELLTPLMKALPAQIPEETAIRVAKDMCMALELCSKHNIVHRDIKPQNIFVSEYGDCKLGDFGIAKTVEKTMGGTKIGTYAFMAPEVFLFRPYGSTADIYSLGLVLYWLLNERRMPFMPLPPEKLKVGMEESARERRFRGEPLPPPAHGSEKLKKIVLKTCAYDPAQRYHTAAEMLQDLENMNAKAALPELVAAAALAPKTAPSPAPEQTTVTSFEPMTKTATAEQTGNTCSTFVPMAKAPTPRSASSASATELEPAMKLSPAAQSYRQHYQQYYEKPQASAQKTREQIAEEYRRNYQAAQGVQQKSEQTPQQQERFYTPLPNNGWRCVCGRDNQKYISSCACGLSRRELQARPEEEKVLKNGNWYCICGRINAHYVSNCACGAKKREVLGR